MSAHHYFIPRPRARVARAALLLLSFGLLGTTASASPDSSSGGPQPIVVSSSTVRPLRVDGLRMGIYRRDLPGVGNDGRPLIAQAMSDAGYSIVKDDDQGDAVTGAVSLSGEVRRLDCGSSEGGTCLFEVEWALYDDRDQALLYRVITRTTVDESTAPSRVAAAEALVVGALHSVLSREKFVTAAGEGRGRYESVLRDATLKSCANSALDLPGESEAALEATALVKTKDGVGSAVFVSPDGYLLTAAHVVGQDSEVQLVLRGGQKARGIVVRIDPSHDVALVRAIGLKKAQRCLPTELGRPKAGQDVYVIGAPAGEELSFSISRGILSGRRTIHGDSYLQTDASINPGNSGGPLLDGRAGILGVVSFKLAGASLEGLGFAVPIGEALEALSLTAGKTTSELLSSEKRREKKLKRPVVDAADPAFAFDPTDDPVRDRRSGGSWSGPVLGAGILGLVAGGTTLIVVAATSDGNSGGAGNAIGWTLVGVGAAATLSALVIPPLIKTEPSRVSSGVELRAIVMPTGIGLHLQH